MASGVRAPGPPSSSASSAAASCRQSDGRAAMMLGGRRGRLWVRPACALTSPLYRAAATAARASPPDAA